MSKTEESDDNWVSKMESLCSALNVDTAAAKKSMDSILDVKGNFTLDVSILNELNIITEVPYVLFLLNALITFTQIFINYLKELPNSLSQHHSCDLIKKYILLLTWLFQGDPLHWMACALYVACRTSITPTVQPGKTVEGNCVSLTKLLRLCNIRYEFNIFMMTNLISLYITYQYQYFYVLWI